MRFSSRRCQCLSVVERCALAGLKNMFVPEGCVCAVGWVELALKDSYAFVPAPSQHLLTFPVKSPLRGRKEPKLTEYGSL